MYSAGRASGYIIVMVGRLYFMRQAAALLRFAKSTSNPQLAATLIQKAADLESQIAPVSSDADKSPLAPDVELEHRKGTDHP